MQQPQHANTDQPGEMKQRSSSQKIRKNSKSKCISKKLSPKDQEDLKETGETLLLLGHNDIHQSGMFMSTDYRDFAVIRPW